MVKLYIVVFKMSKIWLRRVADAPYVPVKNAQLLRSIVLSAPAITI